MKKILSIFLINILLIIAIFTCIEYYTGYKNFNNQGILKGNIWQKFKRTNELFYIRYDCCKNQRYEEHQRPFEYNKNLTKDNIILIGCSYTYGDGLKKDKTFSAKLSKYTNRNVLNLGMRCGSPKESLHILRDKKIRESLLKQVYNEAEYVIFTYITDHKRRIYHDVCDFYYLPNFKYDKRNDNLIYYEKNILLKSSFFINKLRLLYFKNFIKKRNKDFELTKTYFKEINKEVKKNFQTKNKKIAQFVILVYEEEGNEDWISLEKEGIKIIKVKDITGIDVFSRKYQMPNYHPNENAWEEIVPLLTKTLNL